MVFGIAGELLGQREPVLKQIKVPHNYYYREMYLPQVTTGPSAAAWSPDGTTLVYSMAGSLWRQRIGDSIAEQLTDGPGYDYQPDWSPDGKAVAYASYRNDAVQLRLLDLGAMTESELVANGAVNVEPRWSPDGKRLAFVSTAYQGRWHIFTVDPRGDRKPVRITEDVDSKLPRYYYSTYDHYLSPSWSPDSKEILLVSNRGKIWGSGGLWRMEARPGARMMPVHDEETTWQMRPDWAPDGKRVVYSSYLGRQWHQLWLTRADSDDPFQLTYGDFDITHPRWSPDGSRIAYISNESGNTALWVLAMPGTARTAVVPKVRRYRQPMGKVSIRILDAATGRTLPSRVSITLADGRSIAPENSWFHADDGFTRSERTFEVGYFHSPGMSAVTAPAGELSIEITHGPLYRVHRERVTVTPGKTTLRVVRMSRLMALPGWTSGDLHVHMNYGGHYRATPQTLAVQARAEGLNLVENLIVNKEDRFPDLGYFRGFGADPVSTPDLMIVHDQEFHTSWWGHAGVLGLTDHVLMPGYSGYAGTAAASLVPDNGQVNDLARAQGGLTGYVHPFDVDPDPDDRSTPLTVGLPIDVALGKVDYLEVVGFSDHLATSRVWYRLLNCGFRLPAGAGTDAMTNFASLRGPVGTTRVYVQSPAPIDRRAWYGALKAGRSFATNGPLLQLSLNQTGIGGEVRLPGGNHTLRARVNFRSIVPIDHLELIRNGEVIASLPLAGDRTALDTSFALPVTESGWYLLRAYSDKATEPVLDIYPFGTTSPIYVTVGKQPIRSEGDARFFLKWIDRIEEGVEAHDGWNSDSEKRGVLDRVAAARREFESRAR
jgi:hypothetical protein